jgi:hypothetical protein
MNSQEIWTKIYIMELPLSAEQKIELKRQHRQNKRTKIKNNCDVRRRIYGAK